MREVALVGDGFRRLDPVTFEEGGKLELIGGDEYDVARWSGQRASQLGQRGARSVERQKLALDDDRYE